MSLLAHAVAVLVVGALCAAAFGELTALKGLAALVLFWYGVATVHLGRSS